MLYLLAEAFDDDPFLVLAWRGRDRDDAARRAARHRREPAADASTRCAVDEVPLESRLADFYAPGDLARAGCASARPA